MMMGSSKPPTLLAKTARTFALAFLFALPFILSANPVVAQGVESGSRLTPEFLRSRISGVEESTEIEDADKTRLLQLYRQAISNLEQTRAYLLAAEEYSEAAKLAGPKTESIQRSMPQVGTADPAGGLQISESQPTETIYKALQEELAQRSTIEASLAAVEARLLVESTRPSQVRSRITAARTQIEDISGQGDQMSVPDENPLLVEAARWAAETQLQALQAEVVMLDQEMFSHELRVELLRTLRDEAEQRISLVADRIMTLQTAVNERRARLSDLAENEARAVVDGSSGQEKVVRNLAKANLALVERMQRQTETLENLADQEKHFRSLGIKLAEAVRSTRKKLLLAGWDAPAGLVIRLQRQQLPGVRTYARERRDVRRKITSISMFRLESEEERSLLDDIDVYIENHIDEVGPLGEEELADLEQLATTRRSLLDLARRSARNLQRRLYSLDDTLQKLKERTEAYDEFLAQRLLWVRSQGGINAAALADLPGEIAEFGSLPAWHKATLAMAARLVKAPYFMLGILVAVGLFLRRNRILAALAATGENVGRAGQDNMTSTFAAILYTVLLALPIPLVMGLMGQALLSAPSPTIFSNGLATGLTKTGALLLLVLLARAFMKPKGVAELHFDKDPGTMARLHGHFRWMFGPVLLFYFIMVSAYFVNPATTLGRLAFVCFLVGLGIFFLGVGRSFARPLGGILRILAVSFALTILLVATILILIGFTHTVGELIGLCLKSVAWLFMVWVARSVVLRWLLLARRRLAADKASGPDDTGTVQVDDRDGAEAPADEIDDPDVDLVALDEDSRKLLKASTAFLSVLVLAGVWGNVVPALGVLDNLSLWNTVAFVDGVERQVPVSLADVLLAIAFGVGGAITARNLPSVLNIVLIRYTQVTTGGRYASQTLLRYTLVAMTVMVVLSTLGASWEQMGWAAAALGVGIGFGVQEIVANFICGLILLFERPVRVGDVITLGDASGTVTKIRIRATTLRDWDLKELVVPNKELITGRLLNWTLSDSVVRLILNVGVAYGSDVEKALELMIEAAKETELVLQEPNPAVHFEEFGDSSLNLSLRAFVSSFKDRLSATTALHGAIDRKFREAGIVIAFPQRDVNLFQGEAGSEQVAEPHTPEGQEDP